MSKEGREKRRRSCARGKEDRVSGIREEGEKGGEKGRGRTVKRVRSQEMRVRRGKKPRRKRARPFIRGFSS